MDDNASVISMTKTRKTNSRTAKEPMPVAKKLEIKEKKYHKDDLSEQHFTDLRNFLHKKKRQELVHAKMNAKSVDPGKGSKNKDR